MNRVDTGWQARWEMLKIKVAELRRTGVNGSIRGTYRMVQELMDDLEKVHEPILARPIKEYRSPMDGQRRNVFEPLPALVPLPKEGEKQMAKQTVEEAKKALENEIANALKSNLGEGHGYPENPMCKCGSMVFDSSIEFDKGVIKEVAVSCQACGQVSEMLTDMAKHAFIGSAQGGSAQESQGAK